MAKRKPKPEEHISLGTFSRQRFQIDSAPSEDKQPEYNEPEEPKTTLKEILSKRFRPWAYKATKSSVKVLPVNLIYTQLLLRKHGFKDIKVIADKSIIKPCNKKIKA
jgi:hypothetical protein